MAETYVPFTLTTPLGTLNFNATDGSSGYYLSDVQGLDGGNTRHTEFPLPQRDGAVVLDVLLSAAYPTLMGEIRITGTDSLTTRKTLMDTLKAYCDSARKQDATLSWLPTGDNPRQMTVRLAEPVQIGNSGGVLKSFQIQMVAANPYAVKSAGATNSISTVAALGGALVFPMKFPFSFGSTVSNTVTITPGGTTISWPVITITGPVTNPVISNVTTGFSVGFQNLSLGAGVVLTVDMWNESAYIGSTSNSYVGYIDFANSNFWGLLPSTANVIQISSSGGADTPVVSIANSDTFV